MPESTEVIRLRAEVADLRELVRAQGGGATGGNPFMSSLGQPSGGVASGWGSSGNINWRFIPSQGGGGLINKVNSISLGDNFDLVAANKTASQTYTKADITQQLTANGVVEGDFTPEALGMQKILGTNEASAKAQSVANGVNITGAVVGAGCAIASTIANVVIQNKMIKLQERYMDKMEGLAEKYMVLQERGMEINRDIMEGKQRTVVELAEIQAEVAKFQIRKESETSIQNTKTAAAYGWTSGQFYGNPAKQSGFQYSG